MQLIRTDNAHWLPDEAARTIASFLGDASSKAALRNLRLWEERRRRAGEKAGQVLPTHPWGPAVGQSSRALARARAQQALRPRTRQWLRRGYERTLQTLVQRYERRDAVPNRLLVKTVWQSWRDFVIYWK